MSWIDALSALRKSGQSGVLITILGSAGSAPRKSGSKMLVTADQAFDTIGGGHLEFLLVQKAREMLIADDKEPVLDHFPLGPKLGQCCGGSVNVLLEPIAGSPLHIALFGAGHVGKAVVHVLSPLNCRITWIDNRAELFPESLPSNVTAVVCDEPELAVEQLPAGVYALVVTHNHQLDYGITEAVLKKNDSAWLGVIGSKTKARRFRQRLAHRDIFTEEQVQHMRSPVGLEQVGGRTPPEIAIAIAGEILAMVNGSRSQQVQKRQGIPWQELKSLLVEESA
ncbi:xanthine dehydrogenase accessory protein XdhC [Endozoicomonas ascidiicola]|uniref:xanthine dehydrogenase accessory protein XdhC n=1 Tax=Endozoicomonas ascidiicola TaxID=1698521 RepID=UPI000836E348|nr:xanthine dehydrogenase accessory protein XdhC [Endozoicomonas ascidiicola]